MTDKEIIKALGVCISALDCTECPYTNVLKCSIERDCIDLINRQQAEIERLEADIEWQDSSISSLLDIVNSNYQNGRADAAREFAERVKDIIDEPLQIEGRIIDRMLDKIDSLVKEMTEGQK